MCGITGIKAFNQIGAFYMMNLGKSMETLSRRGPNQRGSYIDHTTALGHTRLSIIDLSMQGRQPMKDPTGNYVLLFNGEIFNYKSLRKALEEEGCRFSSDTDTEVLLQLYLREGADCLNKLNGFFAFAVYDIANESLFLARDRFGVKPLLYYTDDDKFIFASEMKALLSYNIPREVDYNSIAQFFHYNYIPGPATGIQGCYKLEPGHYLRVSKKKVLKESYYTLPVPEKYTYTDYTSAQARLYELMEDAVRIRLNADVPVGTFLSGGIDSSVITALAAKDRSGLKTFTIGYEDHRFFDESDHAAIIAKKYSTDHHTFYLTDKELFSSFQEALDYIDEPFADSSALAVYILSKKVNNIAKVALSGDGADELFGGYNKHLAENMIMEGSWKLSLAISSRPILRLLPQSRSGTFGNLVRQLEKLASGAKLDRKERYYQWAGFSGDSLVSDLFTKELRTSLSTEEIKKRIRFQCRHLSSTGDFNEILRNDTELVLSNDMLVKTDMMSMANSLEIRAPFLDYRIVDFAFSLPPTFKTSQHVGKKIIRETFSDLLAPELLSRPKKGFEVPLLHWLRTTLLPELKDSLLSEKYLLEQNIFDSKRVGALISKAYSANPGDTHARLWAVIIFQYWHRKYILRS